MYVNAAQALTLTNVLGVEASNLGNAKGSLALQDELVSMIEALIWAFAYDFIGQRLVYKVEFLLIGAAGISIPYAFKLYPECLLMHLTFAVGATATACVLIAVLADFARDKHLGLLVESIGIVTGLGAILAALVFALLPTRFCRHGFSAIVANSIAYHIVAISSLVFYLAMRFFFLPPQSQSAENEKPPTSAEDTILVKINESM